MRSSALRVSAVSLCVLVSLIGKPANAATSADRKEFKAFWEQSLGYLITTNMGFNMATKLLGEGNVQDAYNLTGHTNEMIKSGETWVTVKGARWGAVNGPMFKIFKSKERQRYLMIKLFEGDDGAKAAMLREFPSADDKNEALLSQATKAAKHQYQIMAGSPGEIATYDQYLKRFSADMIKQMLKQ